MTSTSNFDADHLAANTFLLRPRIFLMCPEQGGVGMFAIPRIPKSKDSERSERSMASLFQKETRGRGENV